jgi:hypothetical protein
LEAALGLPPLVTQALAFSIDYLKPFGMEAVLQMSTSFRPFNSNEEMSLSTNTLQCVALAWACLCFISCGGHASCLEHVHDALLACWRCILNVSLCDMLHRVSMELNTINKHCRLRRQLEILHNSEDGREQGSLLWLLDHTCTPFGSRLLRSWVAHPLKDASRIDERLDAVQELAAAMGARTSNYHPALRPRRLVPPCSHAQPRGSQNSARSTAAPCFGL